MNTSKLSASGLGRIQDATKNASNRKENPQEKRQLSENSASNTKQAKGANRAEIISSLKDKSRIEKPNKDAESSSPKINEYLKMISRFENKVKQNEIEDKDLEKVMKALEEKVLSMNTAQKNRLKNIDFFKKKGVDNLKNMKESLVELFESEKDRETFFDFLKSPDFVSVLLNEQERIKGYTPATGTPKTESSTQAREIKTAAAEPSPKKV
jgi:hypothetical protein